MVSTLRRAIALLLMVLALGIASCGGDRDVPVVLLPEDETTQAANPLIGAIAEVSPPERIQQLKPYLDVYEPQVRIASPDPDETLTSTTVQVQLQVRDFPIYKDQSLGFGPHLHLFVDDQPHQAVYDADTPITLEALAPGTHTLRLLAVRPWGESFKNAGAYDQVTFNVFAASPQNHPDDSKPVLTYNQPQDRYGAEPILLDFHLSNAPPHLVAQADEEIMDWRIRCTVNGESFVFDRWQPIYLQGFKPGKNWIRLELIDENGTLIDNALNTSIRVIDYQPGGEDGLSKLIKGEIPLAQAKALIDPSYEPPAPKVEESIEPAEEEPKAPVEAEPQPETAAEPESATVAPPASTPATEALPTVESPESDSDSEVEAAPEEAATPGAAGDLETEVAPVAPAIPEAIDETPESVPSAPSAITETPPQPDEAGFNAETEKNPQTPVAPSVTDESEALERDRPAQTIPETTEPPSPEDSGAEPTPVPPSASAERPDSSDEETPETDSSEAAPQATPRSDQQPTASTEPEAPVSAENSPPVAPKSNLNGVEADDLTDDSPLMESQDTNFPEDAPAVEPPLTPEEADIPADTAVPSDDLDEKATQQSPRTNLKTLEDNADLI